MLILIIKLTNSKDNLLKNRMNRKELNWKTLINVKKFTLNLIKKGDVATTIESNKKILKKYIEYSINEELSSPIKIFTNLLIKSIL